VNLSNVLLSLSADFSRDRAAVVVKLKLLRTMGKFGLQYMKDSVQGMLPILKFNFKAFKRSRFCRKTP